MKGCYGTVVREGTEWMCRRDGAVPTGLVPSTCLRLILWVYVYICTVVREGAANRLIFQGSIIRPNPQLSLTPTVSFVMY